MFQATPRVWFRPVSGSRHSEGFSKREALINPMFHSSNGNYGPSWFWQYHFVQGGRTFCRLLKCCCSFLCSLAILVGNLTGKWICRKVAEICLLLNVWATTTHFPESGRDLQRFAEICQIALNFAFHSICVWSNTENM